MRRQALRLEQLVARIANELESGRVVDEVERNPLQARRRQSVQIGGDVIDAAHDLLQCDLQSEKNHTQGEKGVESYGWIGLNFGSFCPCCRRRRVAVFTSSAVTR